MIGIINYGMGNLTSVKNALDYLRIETRIVSDPAELRSATGIILPGVGAFGMAMDNLTTKGFTDVIGEMVTVKKVKMLGLCLGMQLLFERSSEHGTHEGLGLLKGSVRHLGDVVPDLTVPHMGWNDVEHAPASTLFADAPSPASYYFVHSYYCEAVDPADVAGTTEYGITFASSVQREHVFGCQFHPEKSQKNGLAVLKRFASV